MSEQENEIPYGDRHYVVIRENRWGADTSLEEAFKNAQFLFLNPFEECCTHIEFANREKLQNISKFNEELRDVHAETCYADQRIDYEFVIFISDMTRWKFTHCNEIDGSPHWDWVGEGDMPDELGGIRIDGKVSESTGLITFLERDES